MALADPQLQQCVYTHDPETLEIYKPNFQEAQYIGSIWVIHYNILLERELYFLQSSRILILCKSSHLATSSTFSHEKEVSKVLSVSTKEMLSARICSPANLPATKTHKICFLCLFTWRWFIKHLWQTAVRFSPRQSKNKALYLCQIMNLPYVYIENITRW